MRLDNDTDNAGDSFVCCPDFYGSVIRAEGIARLRCDPPRKACIINQSIISRVRHQPNLQHCSRSSSAMVASGRVATGMIRLTCPALPRHVQAEASRRLVRTPLESRPPPPSSPHVELSRVLVWLLWGSGRGHLECSTYVYFVTCIYGHQVVSSYGSRGPLVSEDIASHQTACACRQEHSWWCHCGCIATTP